MSLIREVEEAFYKDSHFGDGQSFLVCNSAFEKELSEEIFKFARMAGPNVGPRGASVLTEFFGNPVLISEQVLRFKILTEGRVRPLVGKRN